MGKKSNDFAAIRIGTLRSDEKLSFNVFIRVADRYIHYMPENDILDKERHTKLKKRGVKKLYVPFNEEPKYLEYLDAGLLDLKNDKMNATEKGGVVHGVMSNISEKIDKAIDNEKDYKITEDRVKKVSEFMTADPNALRSVLENAEISTDIFQHSANVSTLALALAAKLGIKNEKELADIGLAALLHDVGKEGSGLPIDLPREKMTLEQKKLYEEHPRLGAEKLAGKPHIHKGIIDMVLMHEEIGEGAGFPNKKVLKQLSLSQQVLNLCNEYDRVCTVYKIQPLEAMVQFFTDKMGLFDLAHLKLLSEIIKKK